jgi:hypothetical protein
MSLSALQELFLGGRRLRCWKERGNGRRRDIGNRLLEGIEFLGKRRDLCGKLFSLGLLSDELVLNDLQLVDGLVLSYLKPLRCLDELVCDLLARRGGHSAGRGGEHLVSPKPQKIDKPPA